MQKPKETQIKPRVLVAEAEVFLAEVYRAKLEFEGFGVELAADGEEAVLKLGEGGYVVVLLNTALPKIDGFGVLKRIRKTHPMLPVVMLSSFGNEADIERSLLLGANSHLVKASVTPAEIVDRMKKAIA